MNNTHVGGKRFAEKFFQRNLIKYASDITGYDMTLHDAPPGFKLKVQKGVELLAELGNKYPHFSNPKQRIIQDYFPTVKVDDTRVNLLSKLTLPGPIKILRKGRTAVTLPALEDVPRIPFVVVPVNRYGYNARHWSTDDNRDRVGFYCGVFYVVEELCGSYGDEDEDKEEEDKTRGKFYHVNTKHGGKMKDLGISASRRDIYKYFKFVREPLSEDEVENLGKREDKDFPRTLDEFYLDWMASKGHCKEFDNYNNTYNFGDDDNDVPSKWDIDQQNTQQRREDEGVEDVSSESEEEEEEEEEVVSDVAEEEVEPAAAAAAEKEPASAEEEEGSAGKEPASEGEEGPAGYGEYDVDPEEGLSSFGGAAPALSPDRIPFEQPDERGQASSSSSSAAATAGQPDVVAVSSARTQVTVYADIRHATLNALPKIAAEFEEQVLDPSYFDIKCISHLVDGNEDEYEPRITYPVFFLFVMQNRHFPRPEYPEMAAAAAANPRDITYKPITYGDFMAIDYINQFLKTAAKRLSRNPEFQVFLIGVTLIDGEISPEIQAAIDDQEGRLVCLQQNSYAPFFQHMIYDTSARGFNVHKFDKKAFYDNIKIALDKFRSSPLIS